MGERAVSVLRKPGPGHFLNGTGDRDGPPLPENPARKNETETEAPAEYPHDPEGVARVFLRGVFLSDREDVERVILPHEDAAVLWKDGEPRNDERHRAVVKHMAEEMTWRELEPGDQVRLTGGRTFRVTKDMAGPDRKVLLPAGPWGRTTPMPIPLRRRDGRWKVDPSPVIPMPRRAQRARRRRLRGQSGAD